MNTSENLASLSTETKSINLDSLESPLPADNFKKYKMEHTPTNKDILQTQDISYTKDKTQLFNW